MGSKANPVLIGGFIVGALALVVVAVLLFAKGTFSNVQKYIIYFDGSVNGLNVGGLVKLKGVSIGKVSDILVLYDEQHGKIMTPVIVEFAPDKIHAVQGEQGIGTGAREIGFLIKQGLRAQLQMQSLLTGQLFVDINFRPETHIKLMGGDHPPYPEIPSIPSPKEQLENTIEEVVSMVRKMPIQQTVAALLNAIQQMEKLLKSPEIASSLITLDHTLKDVQQLIRDLDDKIDPLAKNINGSIQEGKLLLENVNKSTVPLMHSTEGALKAATGAMNQAKATLLTVDQAASPNASLDLALRDLGSTARSLRILADYLERHPDAVLFGKNPKDE